jgi:ubiquinone/menaquinone biosynthesis C-methylase UbiE
MENARFTFSQGIRDIHTTLDFLEHSPQFGPSTSILVSFSGSAIDTRRAVASERGGRVGGWVSVVGSSDLQAMMRVISGGVDYLGGVDRGISFGFQEILGLLVDVDTSSRDALDHQLAFLEDARRDFGGISVPITWIHGRYDAWMDLSRIRHVLSFGDVSQRRLIEVPTGHQLKTSREALATFELIAREVSRMSLGMELAPRLPDLLELGHRQKAERRRLPSREVDIKGFWRRYLVGHEGRLGMELLTSTAAYRKFIDEQIVALGIHGGERILDLGSGTGSFPCQMAASPHGTRPVRVIALDYIHEALLRTRSKLFSTPGALSSRVDYLECDLDLRGDLTRIPLADGSADAAVGALLINYLLEPTRLLSEVRRVLRPGGRLVLSGLRQDADISRICVDGVKELRSGLAQDVFGDEGARGLDESIRVFMSDAARLLDFEELGIFRFFDSQELEKTLSSAGFRVMSIRPGFGDPPQALIATAQRPS